MKGWFWCWTWVGGETWASWALADLGAMPNLLAPPAKVFVWTCTIVNHKLIVRFTCTLYWDLRSLCSSYSGTLCWDLCLCACTCVLVCLCACVPNLAKSTRLASWKALKKPSSGPMHEHWAPKEVSLGFNFEFCKCKWWALNKPFYDLRKVSLGLPNPHSLHSNVFDYWLLSWSHR